MPHKWTCIAVLPLSGLCWRTCAAFASDRDFLHAATVRHPSCNVSTKPTPPALLAWACCNDTPHRSSRNLKTPQLS